MQLHINLPKALSLIWLGVFASYKNVAQCDLQILDFNVDLNVITVAFNNTENCGGSAGPDGIAEIQFGFQAVDADCNAMNQGWDFPWGLSIPDDSFHPGWVYSATTTESPTNWTNLDVWSSYNVDPPYYTGDTVTFPLDDFYQTGGNSLYATLPDVFDFWLDQGLSMQAVIWQISYGPTVYSDEGGWAEGQPTPACCGEYDDENWQDNWVVVGPCEMTSDWMDGIIDDVTFETGCIGDQAYYTVGYTVYNIGPDTIPSYCVDFWFQDQIDCYSGEDLPWLAIPPGDSQMATGGPFAFPWYGGGGFFNLSLDSIPGEVITGNNNTTVYLPEAPECPVVTDTVIVSLPPDTIVEYVSLPPDTVEIAVLDTVEITLTDTVEVVTVDTVYVPWEWYIYDTVYVDVFDTIYVNVLDTVILTETEIEYVYITDTLEFYQVDTVYTTVVDSILQEVIVYEYIYETDTVYEYAVQFIDCDTGLPCDTDGFVDEDCESVFVPNTFTPNNDGINDSFYATMQYTDCWLDWHLQIYNRWGDMIWQTFDPDAQWYGEGPSQDYYVADGVYVWIIKAKGREGLTLDLQGHVTVLR